MEGVFLLGITGPSCSGKSTIVEELKRNFGEVLVINLDDYWYDKSTFPDKNGYKNWEVPSNFKFDILENNLKDLKQSKSTIAPTCDNKFNQSFGTQVFEPRPIIIVEGFLLFYFQKIRDLFDFRVYVDIPDEEIINRRIKRNRSERSKEESEPYYRNVLVTEYKKYGGPAKAYCNLILDGREQINESVQKIMDKLKENIS